MELEDMALKVMQQVAELRPPSGLVPIMISPESGTFASHIVSMGARGDSYYEYLLKTWILLGKPPDHFLLRSAARSHLPCLAPVHCCALSEQVLICGQTWTPEKPGFAARPDMKKLGQQASPFRQTFGHR